ncbi:MAG: holo-ACP synthase [Azonexus sp.]|jgi:holo-[acyl-carrier protein] synthase|nr:holo-ACP synthase [Azonexus sp.]
MILGIGADIVAVARLSALWEKHGDKALEKILAPTEFADFAKAADKGRFLAKRFAAKEAFAKAWGTGVRPPVLLPAVGVSHDEAGKPFFEYHGELAGIVEKRGLIAHLSISDEAEYAVAYVVLECA